MSLRPPSSPSPDNGNGGNKSNRQSMGPTSRVSLGLPQSPRPGARPTSELLAGGSGAGMFQTPEAEALDQWFENLQSYEVTLEEMAAASLDVNFKEELSAIEQWFKVLSEAERTAALYSLLQHSTQVQIRFFITVLQQMARSDPMTALLSPAPGGSMQSQMEAKLASLKSPGLKSTFPSSPTARNFSGSAMRQSMVPETGGANFLSPDSAAMANMSLGAKEEAAATLATQRAKFKASNAAHRISAPVFASTGPDGKMNWGPGSLAEQQPIEEVVNAGGNGGSRPKSTEFSGSRGASNGSNNNNEVSIPAGDSWASMVQTPLIPMFGKKTTAPQEASRGDEWNTNANNGGGVPRMGDPTVHRRTPKSSNASNDPSGVYDDNGNLVSGNGQQRNGNFSRSPNGNNGNGNGANNGGNNFGGWSGGRSPALSSTPPNRFGGMGGSDDGSGNLNGLGMPIGGFGMGMGGMGSPTLGGMAIPNMAAAGMAAPFNLQNMNNMAMLMGLTPDALLAAQMAAAGQLGQPNWMAMQNGGAGMNGGRRQGNANNNNNNNRNGPPGGKTAGATPKAEEDVDPTLLTDIPAWLRSLRLHKYTPNFENIKWQDMVMMDEDALEANGVAALGARRKMLKTFELVRKKMGMEEGGTGGSQSS